MNKRNPIRINPYKSLFDDTASLIEVNQSPGVLTSEKISNSSKDNLNEQPVNDFF